MQLNFHDSRADSTFFLIDIDGTMVYVKVDQPTYGVTEGGVRYACHLGCRLFEGHARDIETARRAIPLNARAWRDGLGLRAEVSTIGTWKPLRRLEESVPCVICAAKMGEPCRDRDGPIVFGGGKALVVGAPWNPEPHTVTTRVTAGAHAARITTYHHMLRGEGGQ